MASSRSMRKSSRLSSPMDNPTKESLPAAEETSVVREQNKIEEEWEEPRLRTPAPSFEDHKGLERQGVLVNMAPLGTFPNQKVRQRLKTHEPSRRPPHARNGDANITKDEPNSSRSTPPVMSRRSEPRKTDDRSAKVQSSRERDEDEDYTPKGASKVTPVKLSPSQPSLHGTPSSRTSAGQERLKQVVDSAVARANELGNPVLGLAVKKLFDESLHNRTLADLLDGVLSQKPTQRQATDFQGYIKIAKKQIKSQGNTGKNSFTIETASESTSKSPTKTTRPSLTRHSGVVKDLPDATATIPTQNPAPSSSKVQIKSSSSKSSSSKPLARKLESNGTVLKSERPAKRRKRSKSASSSSTLSSLSSIDQDFVPTLKINPPTLKLNQPKTTKVQPSLLPDDDSLYPLPGPITKPSNKRSAAAITDNTASSSAEIIAKRRKFEKSFDDYSVNDSDIRAPTLPKPQIQPPSFSPSLANLRTQQPRLRNGSIQRSRRDDYEDLRSPASSGQGELLIPPPAGAQSSSRANTPQQLGRTLKQTKRAARIKMSPMKKKAGVIAGRPHAGGGKDKAVGATGDNGDDANADQCSSCGGNGKLLCCDGCTRSFHFSCLDPPVDPLHPPEGEWFCYDCVAKREPKAKAPPRGVFSSLIDNLGDKNPISYYLPHEVRDFFDGVRTGEEGEYEEAIDYKVKTRAGYEDTPNNLKLKDPKDKVILCFSCGGSALGHREIIPCDHCSLYWHLDCLDPPLAAAPRKFVSATKSKTSWMCPNHVDPVLQDLQGSSTAVGNKHPVTNRRYKVRRPKHPLLQDVAMRRGHVNNGLIEIINEPDDGSEQKIAGGVIYRLSEDGIKMDFINRVKRGNAEAEQARGMPESKSRIRDAKRLRARAQAQAQRAADKERQVEFDRRPFLDRQAALNLAQFSQSGSNADLCLGSTQVDNLIGALIAEAPAEVAALFMATPLPDDDGFATDKGKGKEREAEGLSSLTAPTAPISAPSRLEVVDPELEVEVQQLRNTRELINRRLALLLRGEEAS